MKIRLVTAKGARVHQRKVKVGANDVVIVIRDDGTFEAILPQDVPDPLPDHLITSAALVYALRNPEMISILHKNFALECHKEIPTKQ